MWYIHNDAQPSLLSSSKTITPKRQVVFKDTVLEAFSRGVQQKEERGRPVRRLLENSRGEMTSSADGNGQVWHTVSGLADGQDVGMGGNGEVLALNHRGEEDWRRKRSGGNLHGSFGVLTLRSQLSSPWRSSEAAGCRRLAHCTRNVNLEPRI